ncbi:MAG: response regulator [Myxococcota bacterium]
MAPPPSAVLVVESDPDHQWRLARSLTTMGNRVVGTSSGDGALALVAEWSVDLAIVAEDLPGMDGLELIRRLRARSPQLAVVLLVGPDVPAPRTEGVTVCAKPLSAEALRTALARLALPVDVRPLVPATGRGPGAAETDPARLPLPAE